MHPVIRWILLYLLAFSPLAASKALTVQQVPEPLKPWIDWVLIDQGDLACPSHYNNSSDEKICAWPGGLNLDLQTDKGSFVITWKIFQESRVSLPGNSEHWPQNVIVNQKPGLVMDNDGTPIMKLQPGLHQISGDFFWDSLPENLQIPAEVGLVSLHINGRNIGSPTIKEGQLWLKQSDTGQTRAADSQNNLDIQVFRRIIDEVPLQIQTHLELEVSGQQRELRLPKPLPDGFIPIKLDSALPARLEADGSLLLQLRPGRWQLDLLSRHTSEINQLALPANTSEWPDTEIWVFDARPALRVVEVADISALDASQTNLPEDWKALPAYKISAEQGMTLKIIRRGDPEPEPNRLSLHRQLWLDFSGKAYTANDHITGTMSRDWRLNALPETQLGRVTLDGNNQLITKQTGQTSGGEKPGVEVRKGQINLEADSRIADHAHRLSAVGWAQNFQSVTSELNLPPGWRLLAVSGVDNVPDSWISRWTLLDFFMVLIAALASSHLWSKGWGIFTLVSLALIWHEAEAPHFIWLNILAATALVKVLANTKFLGYMQMYRNICWLILCLLTLPFMVSQLRIGLYPQLERDAWVFPSSTESADALPVAGDVAVSPAPATPAPMFTRSLKKSEMTDAPSRYALAEQDGYSTMENRIDPKAQVQTGPGLPQWQWQKIFLSWNGAVDAGQQINLWLLSPTLNLLLSFIRVILVSMLALLMFGVLEKLLLKFKPATTLIICLLAMPLLSVPDTSYADFPDQTMLDNLKNQLLEPPDCAPSCAQISQMQLKLTEQELNINLQIHAEVSVAVPLPTGSELWFPTRVLVNGENAQGLYRDEQGLWLQLNPGVHQVSLSSPAPGLSKFTLPFPLIPKHASVNSTGWEVLGLQENGRMAEQLQFLRKAAATNTAHASATAEMPNQQLPAFVRIERRLQLGLDWRVINTAIKISPLDSAVLLSVPLLPGESVTTANVRVKSAQIEVNLPAGITVFQWQSSLEKTADIHLLAGQNPQWIEIWEADISPIWHMESTGIAMIHAYSSSQWLPEWHPWPGEELTLNITRPESVAGQSLTIDNSRLSITPGQRSQESTLNFSLRSSLGGLHSIFLPEQAVLQTVTINGQSQPLRMEGKKLTFPIHPGKQEIAVNWQQATGIGNIFSTPAVDLQLESVNSSLNMMLGEDRWVLLTLGPDFGPAVLFWGVILVIALLAAGLCLIPLTPLNYSKWLLLLLGMSQIGWEATLLVIGWLMLLSWRNQFNLNHRPNYFNMLQVILAGLTLIALGLLFLAVEQGLLGSPEMQIAGNQSTAFNLNWYQDRAPAILPTATVISVPLIVYRLLMLGWSLWLALSLLNWLKWGWGCYSNRGLWLKFEKPAKAKKTENTVVKQGDGPKV